MLAPLLDDNLTSELAMYLFNLRGKPKDQKTTLNPGIGNSFNHSIDRAIVNSAINKHGPCNGSRNGYAKTVPPWRFICRGLSLVFFAILSIVCFFHGHDTGNYRTFISMIIISLGLATNSFVVMVNGGRMPAMTDLSTLSEELQARYASIGPNTRFRLLADCIPIGRHLASAGDVLILLGALAWWSQNFY